VSTYRNINLYRTSGLRYDGQPAAQLSIRARISGPTPLTYDDIGFIYNHPYAIYDNRARTVQLLSLRSFIIHVEAPGLATFTTKTRISKSTSNTLSILSTIQNNRANFTIKSRLSQRQGYPIPASYDPQIAVFVATQQYIRASLTGISLKTKTISLRCRIKPGKTTTFTGQARLVSGQSIGIKANIIAWKTYVHLPCDFTVQIVVKKRLRMVFYTEGTYWTPKFTTKARIVKVAKKRFTGHFIVPMPAVTGLLTNSSNTTYKHVMGIKAFIGRQ
jgi:hypothetical protein